MDPEFKALDERADEPVILGVRAAAPRQVTQLVPDVAGLVAGLPGHAGVGVGGHATVGVGERVGRLAAAPEEQRNDTEEQAAEQDDRRREGGEPTTLRRPPD